MTGRCHETVIGSTEPVISVISGTERTDLTLRTDRIRSDGCRLTDTHRRRISAAEREDPTMGSTRL